MKYLFLLFQFLLLSVMIAGCVSAPDHRLERDEGKKHFEAIQQDSQWLWGEGFANMKGDFGAEDKRAKQSALSNLTGKLETRVVNDIDQQISSHTTTLGEQRIQKVVRQFKTQTRLYIDKVISDRQTR